MQTARVNGIDLEYEAMGSGEPVLLVSPVLADGFLPLLSEPSLADHYRLIRYHKRGWAGSTHTPPPVEIADHVKDAAALLGHLGVRRAHIAGHSSGGAIALQLALDHRAPSGAPPRGAGPDRDRGRRSMRKPERYRGNVSRYIASGEPRDG